jgi:hypothetical protein
MTLDEWPLRTLGREINMLDKTAVQTNDTTCGYCKKKGHTAEECQKKMRDTEPKRKTNGESNRKPQKG